MEFKINTIYIKMKCIDVNLTRYVQNLYEENYKILMKEIKKELNGEIYYVNGQEESILSK